MTTNPVTLEWNYRTQINEWIEQACAANGVPELAQGIKWSFNGRFTRRMGDANLLTFEIRFSAPLWERAGLEEQRNTAKHEAAHIIARKLYGYNIKSHGREWKSCMRKTGERPDRTHCVNRDGLRRKQKRYTARCGCKTHLISGVRRSRILRGRWYKCRTCGLRLNLI